MTAEAAKDARLKTRTLTNLYNERRAWLRLADRKLDAAVLAAYAATDPALRNKTSGAAGWDLAWAEVSEPFGAGEITIKSSGKGKDTPEHAAAKEAAIAGRMDTDAEMLALSLRLNQQRAEAGMPRPAKARGNESKATAKKPPTKKGKRP